MSTPTITASRRAWFGIQADPKCPPTRAIEALVRYYRERYAHSPTLILVGTASAVHERRDSSVVRLAGRGEPVVRPNCYYALIEPGATREEDA